MVGGWVRLKTYSRVQGGCGWSKRTYDAIILENENLTSVFPILSKIVAKNGQQFLTNIKEIFVRWYRCTENDISKKINLSGYIYFM